MTLSAPKQANHANVGMKAIEFTHFIARIERLAMQHIMANHLPTTLNNDAIRSINFACIKTLTNTGWLKKCGTLSAAALIFAQYWRWQY